MSEEESVARLRTLGLNLYESRAYLALLNGKQLTAKQIGQFALIPQSRTYDVLESLARKGFAQATPASPPSYVPIPPKEALSSRYDSERKRIQEHVSKIHEDAQAKLEAVRDAYLSLTKDFPSSTRGGHEPDRVWVLKERENIESTLLGFIKDAKSEVLRITKPPELKSNKPLDPFYIVGLENQKLVFDALRRKVVMKWLSLAREIPTYLGLEVGEPPERRYLDRDEDITEKFLIVDNRSALLNLHDPLSPGYGYVALAMQSRAASSIFRDHFEKMWDKGKTLDEVLPRMRRLVVDVCADLSERGFGKAEVTVYRTLARLGAVTQDVLESEMAKKKVRSQDTTALCSKLIKLGLIHKDSAHRLLMIEHPMDVRASMSTGRIEPDTGTRLTTLPTVSGTNP